jgi:hypothetical protein
MLKRPRERERHTNHIGCSRRGLEPNNSVPVKRKPLAREGCLPITSRRDKQTNSRLRRVENLGEPRSLDDVATLG